MRRCTPIILLLLTCASLWWPGTARAAGNLIVTPASGPPETVFTVTGRGYTGRDRVQLVVYYLAPAASGGQGERHVLEPLVPVGADGGFTFNIDSVAFAPARYTVIDAGPPLGASATFTVTGNTAPTPGLPNTGGGAAERSTPAWQLAALLIVLLILIGHDRSLRRMTTSIAERM